MLVRLASLAVVLALAGCSDGGGVGDSTTGGSSSTTTSGTLGVPSVAAQPMTRHLDWNGSLVAGAWFCEPTVVQDCMAQPSGAFGTHHEFEGLLGNVTAGALRLEWMAANLATRQLVLEASVFTPDCDDCDYTQLDGVSGASPLTLDLPDGLRFDAGEVLFIAVYNNQYTATDQGAAGTSGDQDFRVYGDVTLL